MSISDDRQIYQRAGLAIARAYRKVQWDGKNYLLAPSEWMAILNSVGGAEAMASVRLKEDPHVSITLEDIMLRKKAAEEAISVVLRNFTTSTGLEVHDIDFTTEWEMTSPPTPHIINVSLDVRIMPRYR